MLQQATHRSPSLAVRVVDDWRRPVYSRCDFGFLAGRLCALADAGIGGSDIFRFHPSSEPSSCTSLVTYSPAVSCLTVFDSSRGTKVVLRLQTWCFSGAGASPNRPLSLCAKRPRGLAPTVEAEWKENDWVILGPKCRTNRGRTGRQLTTTPMLSSGVPPRPMTTMLKVMSGPCAILKV